MRTLIVRAAFATVLVPVAAGAQLPLTESEALARLSTESPRVKAIRASADLARADALSAARWPNPRITVNRESVIGITEYITTIGQVVPLTGRRGLAMSAASAHADAAGSRADDEIRRARADLRLSFIDAVAAQFREHEWGLVAGQVQDLAAVLAKREAAGDAAGFDRLRAERAALDMEEDRFALAVATKSALATLAAFFANTPYDGISVVPPRVAGWTFDLPPRQDVPSVEELLARAEATRGELRALQQDVASAEFADRAATRSLYPEPEIVAGTKSSSAGTGDVGGVFAVHATVPLFDRASPERATARARAVEAGARAEAFGTALRTQISALRWTVYELRNRADTYRLSQNANRDLERIAQVSYEAGERGIVELLDVYRTIAASRMRQIDLDLALRRVEIELEFASGWELQ